MKIVQNFQVLGFKKGELDNEGNLKKDRIMGFITPVLKDLNKDMIDLKSEEEMFFDSYLESTQKILKPGVLYKGKFEIPRYIEKGMVNLRLVEVL